MDADLRDLLAAWLGTADPGDDRRAALLARLRDDVAFRDQFVAEARLLGMLKAVQSPEPRWLRIRDAIDAAAVEPAPDTAFEERVMRAVRSRPARGWRSRAALAAAAVAACVALFAIMRPSSNAVGSRSVVELGTVARAEGVVGNAPAEGEIVRTGLLHVTSGRLTLALYNGVSLTVVGPAELDLQAVDRVACAHGKLRARVPVGAEGFTVAAGRAEVVELGADFGLNVEPDGTVRVMTFKGSAAVSLLRDDGRSHLSSMVESNQSAEIDPDAVAIRPIPPRPEDFAGVPESSPTALHLAAAYAAEVGRSQPWSYWRFEALSAEGLTPNERPAQPALRAVGPAQLDGVAGQNRCALFRHDEPFQAFVMEGEWTPPRDSGYAIELWVRSDFAGLRALVSLIAKDGAADENHVALIELTARGDEASYRPCVVRFLDRWPPALRGGVNVFSRRSYIPDRWHHIVAQRNPGSDELFVDGTLVASTPADADPTTVPCRLLIGRLKRTLHPYYIEVRPFAGRIDELAVYERALSSDEIRRHYQSAGPAVAKH